MTATDKYAALAHQLLGLVDQFTQQSKLPNITQVQARVRFLAAANRALERAALEAEYESLEWCGNQTENDAVLKRFDEVATRLVALDAGAKR